MMTSDYNDNHKVVQANDLVRQTTGTINTVPLKMLKVLISCIDTSNPPKDNAVCISKGELIKFAGSQELGEYSYLKKQLGELITPITLVDDKKRMKKVALITDVEWNKSTNIVRCTFHRDIMPYLIDLKKLFLQYEVLNLIDFHSKYGIILYENLLSYTRQYNKKEIKLSVAELRRLTGTEKKYQLFKDFEKKVLKVAVDEINNHKYVEFLVTYEKIKIGRTIDSIIFRLRKRTSFADTLDHVSYPQNLNKKI